MQPVTMTLPLAVMASPMAARDSSFALSRKPQVLTMTTSAPSWVLEKSYPSDRSWVMIRSESTSAFGQPRLTMPTFGAVFTSRWSERSSVRILYSACFMGLAYTGKLREILGLRELPGAETAFFSGVLRRQRRQRLQYSGT